MHVVLLMVEMNAVIGIYRASKLQNAKSVYSIFKVRTLVAN